MAHGVLRMSCSVARGHVGLCEVQSLLRWCLGIVKESRVPMFPFGKGPLLDCPQASSGKELV